MDIFNLFSNKTPQEILQHKYDKLMSKAYEQDQTNIKAAETTRRSAEQVLHKMMQMKPVTT